MSTLEALAAQISILVPSLSPEDPQHIKIFTLTRDYMEAAKAENAKLESKEITMNLAILWKKSFPWVGDYLALRNLHQNLLPLLEEKGSRHLQVKAAGKLARHPKENQEEILRQLMEASKIEERGSAARLWENLIKLNNATFGAQKQKMKKPRSEPNNGKALVVERAAAADIAKAFSVTKPEPTLAPSPVPTPAPTPRPTPRPVPILSQLASEEEKVEALRDFFTLRSYRHEPRSPAPTQPPPPVTWSGNRLIHTASKKTKAADPE